MLPKVNLKGNSYAKGQRNYIIYALMLLFFGTLIYLSVGEEWHLPVIRLIMFLIERIPPFDLFSAIYARELYIIAGSFTFTDHCGI